jgi:hypothetical protein
VLVSRAILVVISFAEMRPWTTMETDRQLGQAHWDWDNEDCGFQHFMHECDSQIHRIWESTQFQKFTISFAMKVAFQWPPMAIQHCSGVAVDATSSTSTNHPVLSALLPREIPWSRQSREKVVN